MCIIGTRWRGLLAPINKPTGDGRRIAPGGFTHRPLPLPLKWQHKTTNGHDTSVTVGVIDTMNIDEELGEVWGEGEMFDDVSPLHTPQLAEDARHALALMEKRVVGPSVDPGSAQAVAVMQGMDRAPTMAEIDRFCADHGGQMPPTEMLFTGYEIAGVTLVPIPAFSEARPLELLGRAALTAAAVTEMAAAVLPQLDGSVFLDPQLDRITPLTREPMGNGWTRVYGHIATHDVCHVGLRDACTTAPFSDQDYQTFHRYHRTAGGIELPLAVGRLTAAHGQLSATCRCCPGNDDHACNNISFGATVAHHDRMRVLSYGRAGEDEKNNAIWFAGVEAPEADDRDSALLSRQKVSGDWREVAGNMELAEILVLARREPGFPLPRVSMENGRQRSLTAASPIPEIRAVVEREGGAIEMVDIEQLGSAIGRGFASALEDFGFNPDQRRGPDGKWVKMGGKGSAGGSLPGRKPGSSRKSEGGGTGAGGRDSGAGATPARDSNGSDARNRAMLDLGRQLTGAGDDFDDDDAELDDVLTQLDDAITAGDVTKSDSLADEAEALMQDDWRARGRIPGRDSGSDDGGAGDSVMTRKLSAHNQDVLRRAHEVQGDNEADDNPDNELQEQIDLVESLTRDQGKSSPEVDAAAEVLRVMLGTYLDDEDNPEFDPDEYPGITAAAQVHTGAMIALRMSEQDAARLAVTDGEPQDQLHLTLAYLGDADQIAPEARERIAERMDSIVSEYDAPLDGDGFAIDVFNPGTTNSQDTAIVMGVGGQSMADVHAAVLAALSDVDGLQMPEQHAPHVPHITLQYTDDLNRVKAVADRVGPVKFDRLRLAFGGEITDIPIGAIKAINEQGDRAEQVEGATMASGSAEMCAKVGCDKNSAECASCADCTSAELAGAEPAGAEYGQRARAAAFAVRATLASTQLGCCKPSVK